MGIGVIGIQTNQKKEQAGPPFVSGSAANGLSVDPVTGQIVLGQDVGAAGDPAILTSVREIPFSGQGIILSDTPSLINTLFFPGFIQINTATSGVILDQDSLQIARTSPGSPAIILLNDTFAQVIQGMDSTGIYTMVSNLVGQFGQYNPATGNWQVGNNPGNPGAFNGAQLEVVGDLTYDLSVNTAAGNPAIDDVNDRGRLFINTAGARTCTLPDAPQVGFHCMFCVRTATNLVVQAGAADHINIANIAGVVGGNATSNAVGSFLHLVYVGGNEWTAASSLGAWVLV